MNSPVAIWGEIAQRWTDLQGQILENQWTNQTKCEDWDVAELVKHANGWQATGGAVLGAEVTPDASWTVIHAAVSAAIADPSNLEGNAEAFNNLPKHQLLGLLVGDLTVHCWDLATAIGADATLPAEAVDATLIGLQRMPPQMLRGNNMFGPPIEISDDASTQDKLIAFTGRQP